MFGKPLSKFQVTRHKAVDMLREIELARVGVHYAAWASDVEVDDREIAAASAKAYAAHAANYVTAECIQIHGGVGYTWECDAHLFLRRAKVNDLLLGYQGWQRARVADLYFASLCKSRGAPRRAVGHDGEVNAPGHRLQWPELPRAPPRRDRRRARQRAWSRRSGSAAATARRSRRAAGSPTAAACSSKRCRPRRIPTRR